MAAFFRPAQENIDDWLIVNQALSINPDKARETLEAALQQAAQGV